MTDVLVFSLGTQRFGLLLSFVIHAVRMVEITPLPSEIPSVAGVIDYHGTIIPVFSIKARFHIPENGVKTSDMLIISKGERLSAIIAEQVIGVTHYDDPMILPETIHTSLTGFEGIVQRDDGMIIITNPDRFLTSAEEIHLNELLSKGNE